MRSARVPAMERYKVKLPTDEAFEKAVRLVEGEVPLYVRSQKRRTLSVGCLPPDVERRLRALGGRVYDEERYDLEVTAGA